MKYFFDTEFIEDGVTIDLLSIGVVCEDGREFYQENSYADHARASEWVQENVLPHLAGVAVSPKRIAAQLIEFVKAGKEPPEFWAYYGDYDWVVVCQLFGTMMDLPDGWPMFAMDVKQLCMFLGNPRLPEQADTEHHALCDARWTKEAYEFLESMAAPSGRSAFSSDDLVSRQQVRNAIDQEFLGRVEDDEWVRETTAAIHRVLVTVLDSVPSVTPRSFPKG